MQQAINKIKPELRQWIKDAVTEVLINTVSVVLVKLKDEIIAAYVITKSEAYVSSVKLAMKHMIKYFGPQMEIGKIGVKELEGFLGYLMKGAPKGYRVYYRTLKAVFNVAVNWGYIQFNPFTKIKLPKVQINKTEYPTLEELDKITNHLIIKSSKIGCSRRKKEAYELISKIIITAYFTGLRINELLNLRWTNIDFKEAVLTVGDSKFTTKGRNQRQVPIFDKVMELFKVLEKNKKDKNDFVFRTPSGKRFTKDYVSKTFKKICRDLGLDEGIKFHSNRHAYGSLLASKGVPIYHIKELMGHSSSVTSERYCTVKLATLKDSIRAINMEVK